MRVYDYILVIQGKVFYFYFFCFVVIYINLYFLTHTRVHKSYREHTHISEFGTKILCACAIILQLSVKLFVFLFVFFLSLLHFVLLCSAMYTQTRMLATHLCSNTDALTPNIVTHMVTLKWCFIATFYISSISLLTIPLFD